MELTTLSDIALVFISSLLGGIVLGLILTHRTPPYLKDSRLRIHDPAAWKKNIETRWSD